MGLQRVGTLVDGVDQEHRGAAEHPQLGLQGVREAAQLEPARGEVLEQAGPVDHEQRDPLFAHLPAQQVEARLQPVPRDRLIDAQVAQALGDLLRVVEAEAAQVG